MKIKVYQIDREKNEQIAHYKMFSSMRLLKSMGLEFDPNDYKVVFDGELNVTDAEDVYRLLNIGQKPQGYKGHSLSTSDVVVMNGKALFCDSFGFIDVTDKWGNK